MTEPSTNGGGRLFSDGHARTGEPKRILSRQFPTHQTVPFEVKDCGAYGLQLYLYRNDGVVRYSMIEIVASLNVHSAVPPKPLIGATP